LESLTIHYGQRIETIWKYELDWPTATVYMPKGAQILRVGVQNGNIFVWAMHDAEVEETEPRAFMTVGTGWEFDAKPTAVYLGSVSIPETTIGELVFHIFEVFN
jgi:hypothetical protein